MKPPAPREVLQSVLEEQGLKASYLWEHTELTEKKVRSLLKGDLKFDEECAVEVGHLFGPSATYWRMLQKTYENGEL